MLEKEDGEGLCHACRPWVPLKSKNTKPMSHEWISKSGKRVYNVIVAIFSIYGVSVFTKRDM